LLKVLLYHINGHSLAAWNKIIHEEGGANMSMFTRRRRNNIFYLILALALVPSAMVGISGLIGLHPRDIQFFSEDYGAEFSLGKGLSEVGSIEMRSSGRSKLVIKEGSREEEFPFTAEGTYLKGGIDTGTYPVLWVRFPAQEKMNRPSRFAELISQLKVTDLTGLLGPRGRVYKLHAEESTILWSPIIGSQFSHPVDILDARGRVVASGIYDTTCGMAEELTVFKNGVMGTITLTETDFPISRNRNLGLLYTAILSVLLLLYHFIQRRKKIEDKRLFRVETDLIILGIIVVMVDVWVDIWFFHCVKAAGLVILHVLVIGLVFWRFGLWGIFPLVELGWAAAFAVASREFTPQFAFFPGIVITWFALVEFHSFRGRLKEKDAREAEKQPA
jgi:hypothetical protein